MSGERPPWLDSYGPGVSGTLEYGTATLVDQFDEAVAAHGERPATDSSDAPRRMPRWAGRWRVPPRACAGWGSVRVTPSC
jgi:hypothetical protein